MIFEISFIFVNFYVSFCFAYSAAVIEFTPLYDLFLVDASKALWIQRSNLASYDVNTNHKPLCFSHCECSVVSIKFVVVH